MQFIPRPLTNSADISRGKTTRKNVLQGIISAVLVLVLLYLLLGLVALVIARTIPDSWERKMSFAEAIISSSDTNQLALSRTVLAKLMEGENLRDLNFNLFLIKADGPNAVAVPGGGIGVTTELLEAITNEIGLAFVLAHELGHHQNRHILTRMGRGLIFSVATSLFFGSDAVTSALPLVESGHSRSQEEAADEFAMRLVHKKYGTTTGALLFFEQLHKKGGEWLWQKYAGTHPLTKDRLAKMQNLERKLTQRPPSSEVTNSNKNN